MKKNNYCSIYLVRHGESEGNLTDMRGANTKLTEKGKQQATAFAKKFNIGHFDMILSSPLVRAQQTAEIIALEHKLAVITKEALKERFSGIFEGKQYDEIRDKITKYNEQRKNLPYEKAKKLSLGEGFETDEKMMGRFITALREIAIAYPGKNILIASHFGVMRTLLVHLGFTTFKKLTGHKLANTAHIKLKTDGVDFFVEEVEGLKPVKQYYQ